MGTRLLVDVSNMCHRSWNTHLSELDNGVIYGFLRTVMSLEKTFATHGHFVFCFDGGSGARRAVDPDYKGNRNHSGMEDLFRQMRDVRSILTDLGMNVWREEGVEADDLIANGITNDCYIVSNDKDFHQLLQRVFVMQLMHTQQGIYKYTVDDLFVDYECEPHEWHKVLALAGDKVDNITGVDGVGYKKAVQFLHGIIKQRHKVWPAINEFIADGHFERNCKLTKLPLTKVTPPAFAGVARFMDVGDDVWNEMCLKWSMRSLLRKTSFTSESERIEL